MSIFLGSYQLSFCLSFFCFCSCSSVQASGRAGNRSTQTSHSHCALLDGGSVFPTDLKMLEDILFLCLIVKNVTRGCFGRLDVEGSTTTAFNPLASLKHVLCR